MRDHLIPVGQYKTVRVWTKEHKPIYQTVPRLRLIHVSSSKFKKPHQSARECERRVRQRNRS